MVTVLILGKIVKFVILEKKRGKLDSVDCTPPDYIMPGAKDRPLLPLHPGVRDMKVKISLEEYIGVDTAFALLAKDV